MNKRLEKEAIKDFLGSWMFETLIFGIICLSLYAIIVNLPLELSLIDNFINILGNPWFFSGSFIIIILVADLYVYNRFKENKGLSLRMETYDKYEKYIANIIYKINKILYFVTIIILICILNFTFSKLGLRMMQNYNIPNILYLFYQLVKTYALMQILAKLNIEILKIIDAKIIIVLNLIVLYFNIETYDSNDIVVKSIKDIFWAYDKYVHIYVYDSFFLELQCFTIYMLCSILVLYAIDKITKKYLKGGY